MKHYKEFAIAVCMISSIVFVCGMISIFKTEQPKIDQAQYKAKMPELIVGAETAEVPATEYAYLTDEMVEYDENELIEDALLTNATRIDNVTVSHYCICEKCCGKKPDDPAYGITASGLAATPYVTVAVDPVIIPLGSDVLVDYGDGAIEYYRADDTGSGVNGNHIDLCVSSHEEAINLGLRNATVYFVPPVS